MDNYGCIWKRFEAKDGGSDTEQYALQAGGPGFESPHLHHLTIIKKWTENRPTFCSRAIWESMSELGKNRPLFATTHEMSHHPPDCGSRTLEELIQLTEDPDWKVD